MAKGSSDIVRGYDTHVTQRGYKVARIHYTADPEKRSDEFKAAIEEIYPDISARRREFEIDWSASSGLPFYTTFVHHHSENQSFYVRDIALLNPPNPVYRCWDFGFRMPACVFFQVTNTNRVLVFKELCPKNIDIHSFRDLVMYLSGQITMDDKSLGRRPRALEYIEQHNLDPWFKKRDFLDFAGQEGTSVRSIEGEKGEHNDIQVLAEREIYVSALPQRVTAGEYIIRRLLHPQPDGDPGIMFTKDCPILIEGFNGGLTFKRKTSSNPLDDKCAKDGYFEHCHDALRYGVNGTIALEETYPEPKEQEYVRMEYERLEPLPEGVESWVTTDW